MELLKYTLPIYWASYLINGDDSGLEPGEKDEIDAFLESENISILDVSEYQPFTWWNDATDIGGEVAKYTAIKKPE